jgi:hypothetical protein
VKQHTNVLVLCDGSDEMSVAAKEIAAALKSSKVVVMNAEEFSATDILPADICFLGCLQAKPDSYSEVERVLKGVNLANRYCGLFTRESEDAVNYLQSIVKDSELRLVAAPFFTNAGKSIGAWASDISSRS